MQSTNSEYGSPYLAVCHVTFISILSISLPLTEFYGNHVFTVRLDIRQSKNAK